MALHAVGVLEVALGRGHCPAAPGAMSLLVSIVAGGDFAYFLPGNRHTATRVATQAPTEGLLQNRGDDHGRPMDLSHQL